MRQADWDRLTKAARVVALNDAGFNDPEPSRPEEILSGIFAAAGLSWPGFRGSEADPEREAGIEARLLDLYNAVYEDSAAAKRGAARAAAAGAARRLADTIAGALGRFIEGEIEDDELVGCGASVSYSPGAVRVALPDGRLVDIKVTVGR